MAEGDLKIGSHSVSKKKATVGAIIGVVVIGGFVYERRKQAAAVAANNTNSSTNTDSSNIDPATNQPYGSPADQAALAAMQDSSSFVTGDGNIVGYDQYGDPIYGTGTGGGISGLPGTPGVPGPGQFTSNAQWTQYVEQAMGSDGADAIAAALGKYLLGSPLTDTQVTTVQQAVALGNYPPVAGSGGYPPNYKTAAPTPPPTSKPPTGSTTIKLVSVVGMRGEDAHRTLEALGLKVSQVPATTQKGKSTTVVSQSPKAGASVKKGSTVTIHLRVNG